MVTYKINIVKNSQGINTFMFSCDNIKYVRHDLHATSSHLYSLRTPATRVTPRPQDSVMIVTHCSFKNVTILQLSMSLQSTRHPYRFGSCFMHASMVLQPLKTQTMDVTQWQDKWSHTHTHECVCPVAEAANGMWWAGLRKGVGSGRGFKHQPLIIHSERVTRRNDPWDKQFMTPVCRR